MSIRGRRSLRADRWQPADRSRPAGRSLRVDRLRPFERSRLSHGDALRQAVASIASRRLRSALSAVGIAIGIAALTAIVGVSATNQAQLLSTLDAGGANVITVSAASEATGGRGVLPETAPPMISRIAGVLSVAVLHAVPDGLYAYKNDLVPPEQSNGLTVAATGPDYLAGVGGIISTGQWLSQTTRSLPVAVLGAEAARLLAVDRVGDRVWIGNQWYSVAGIVARRPLIAGFDSTVFIGDTWSEARLWPSAGELARHPGHIVSLTVRADADRLEQVRALLAATADPARPADASVSNPSSLSSSRALVDDSLSSLVVALAAVALLVGAIGVANTMVVSVLERRGEIGLRRALGARPSHIARQFLLECVIVSGFGGAAGWVVGTLAVCVVAVVGAEPPVLPLVTLVGSPVLAVVVGALTGLQPAVKAARVSPTTSLKAA